MNSQKKLLLLILLGVLGWWLWQDYQNRQADAEKKAQPAPAPVQPDEQKKRKPILPRLPRPWGPHVGDWSVAGVCPDKGCQRFVCRDKNGNCICGSACQCQSRFFAPEDTKKIQEGGRTSPDGKVTLVVDLPESERKKNISSKGLGCCVFRSIEYASRWQNEPKLFDLPEQMVHAGIAGGGYPEKVTTILAKFGPDVQYVQDTSGDPAVLEAILKSGRMPCVTYDGRDGVHYNGGIAHMVCLPYFDRSTGWACVSDNNFIKENQFLWMSCDDFVKRWKGNGGGWVVALLAAPPPPVPHN